MKKILLSKLIDPAGMNVLKNKVDPIILADSSISLTASSRLPGLSLVQPASSLVFLMTWETFVTQARIITLIGDGTAVYFLCGNLGILMQ